MKSLIRWSATVGLLGSTLIGTWFAQMPKVLALPEAEVVKVLQGVPVFTITTEDGGPLIANLDDQKVTQVFMSQKDANEFLSKLKETQPEIGNRVKVQPVSLGEIYRFALANNTETESLRFAYVPMRSAVESAKKLLSDNGQEYQGGVPLFILRGGPDNSILTIQQDNQEVIPFFFEKAPIQAIAERMKQDQPEIAETMQIEVVALENIIGSLHSNDDAMLKQIQLVPSQETIKFIQDAIKSQQSQGE
ncbi:Tic22 family protein [Crocosphaera sp. Alani8]|uniref:Tic22 family protein n=1 Tax=Crocosphaera sp. Alani8 TaxID=3038952 RepID=UPI00313DC29E